MNVGDHIELVVLPGNKLGPAGDTYFTRRAMERGTIEIEDVLDIPEIRDVPSGATVLDVGAFVGDTSQHFLRCRCTVYAFEPFFDAYLCLKHNCPNAVCVHAAVGNGESVDLSAVIPGDQYGARYVQRGYAQRTVRIDGLCLQSCHLIKVDTEGWELFVLRGAAETIRRHRPVLVVEHLPERMKEAGYSETDLTDYIDSLGYTMRVFGEPPRWDWVCTPK